MAGVGEKVEVDLAALSGDHLGTLRIAPHETVSRVKGIIQEEFGYPPESQQLLLHDAVLDGESLVEGLPRPCPLSLVVLPFDKNEALFSAAKTGHGAAVRSLLLRVAHDHEESCSMLFAKAAAGAGDVFKYEDEKDEGRTALHLAARAGHESALRAMLESAHTPEAREQLLLQRDPRAATGLHLAASEGHAMAVRALLESAPSAEVRERMLMLVGKFFDRTALFEAASRGHEMTIRALLEFAPSTEVREQMLVHRTAGGVTALDQAASNGHAMGIRALLQSAANTQVQEQLLVQGGFRGWTALHHAVSNSEEMAARALLEAAPSLHVRERMLFAQDWAGSTALQFAASCICPGRPKSRTVHQVLSESVANLRTLDSTDGGC